jgi:TrmH family RNA methyltransferase
MTILSLGYHWSVTMPLDPRIAAFRSARTDPSLAVLEGFHAIKHAIRFGAEFDSVATPDAAGLREFAERLAPDVHAALVRLSVEVPRDVFDQLSPTPPDTGVIAIARRHVTSFAEVVALRGGAPIVLLESPSHSGNIGAVVRVAAGAGAAAVVTTGPNDPWNPGAIRGSAGLHYALPVIRTGAAEFGDRDLIAIDPKGDELTSGAISPGAILAFGSERSGLSREFLAKARRRIRIPMQPGVSSLNLATAVAVVLYIWRLSR